MNLLLEAKRTSAPAQINRKTASITLVISSMKERLPFPNITISFLEREQAMRLMEKIGIFRIMECARIESEEGENGGKCLVNQADCRREG